MHFVSCILVIVPFLLCSVALSVNQWLLMPEPMAPMPSANQVHRTNFRCWNTIESRRILDFCFFLQDAHTPTPCVQGFHCALGWHTHFWKFIVFSILAWGWRKGLLRGTITTSSLIEGWQLMTNVVFCRLSCRWCSANKVMYFRNPS